MTIDVRRVVTGHDENGNAIVLFDSRAGNVSSQRAGQERCLLWTTDTLPASNDGDEDQAEVEIKIPHVGGSVFGILKLDPGIAPRAHRTASIDYGIVLSGQLGLKLDEGEVVLGPGDVFVQRGTMHTWFNNADEPCIFAVVMVDAKPATAGEKPLGTAG
jgi:quercetin dioxygenase-like cupin family protein